MTVHPHLTNPYSLKIFRLTPYNSEILVRSRPQVHCFHRSEGEGGTPVRSPNFALFAKFRARYLSVTFTLSRSCQKNGHTV